MPELSALHFAALAILFGIGAVTGWLLRADRCAREKIAVNAGWQEQFESQQAESGRLADQNRGLMDQINEHRASENDLARINGEISGALKESTDRCDELLRQCEDLRGQLDVAVRQRDELRTDLRGREIGSETSANALREKDNKIFRLSRELSSWQNRLPPLVEKYRQHELELKELEYELEVAQERNREIDELRNELAWARDRISELDTLQPPEDTRIESIDDERLARGLDASNDQYGESSEADLSDLEDPVDDWSPPSEAGNGRYALDFLGGFADEPAASAADRTFALSVRDDLQQIKGVGPALERMLNDLGIFRYEQIASISEYEIDRIAAQLRGFRTRIYREDWIGQARSLQSRKPGSPLV